MSAEGDPVFTFSLTGGRLSPISYATGKNYRPPYLEISHSGVLDIPVKGSFGTTHDITHLRRYTET